LKQPGNQFGRFGTNSDTPIKIIGFVDFKLKKFKFK